MIPWADVLYGCDPDWWRVYQGTTFQGEKWSTHEEEKQGLGCSHANDKTEAQEKWGVRLVKGQQANTFSLDPSVIHYGNNAGFQAINLAILFGCEYIVLVGYDMQRTGGKAHFFGDHPEPLGNNADYERWCRHFDNAAEQLPSNIEIVNATPNTALTCFRKVRLDDALAVHDLLAA